MPVTLSPNMQYSWVIESISCRPVETVYAVFWGRRVTTDNGVSYTTYDAIEITVQSQDFIPYSELTFEQVCAWLEASLGPEKLAEIDGHLANLVSTPTNTVVFPLPWAD